MQPEKLQSASVATAPRVLLTDTTRWASAARLTISLAKVGLEVSAACPLTGHPLLKTRVVRRMFDYSSLHPLQSLKAAIDASDPQIIIPCDDRAVQHLHELYALEIARGASGSGIVSLIERSLGSPASYPLVTSRFDLLRTAAEEGIRVPETVAVSNTEELKSWSTRSPFPWVLKADGTFGGRGVRIAYSQEEAEQCFRKLTGMFGLRRAVKRLILNRDSFWLRPWWTGVRPSITVQSFVQGRPANCGVVCWEGKVLAGIAVDVVSTEGLTNPATVVNVVDNPEMMAAAERIARRLNLSGFFGLDFVIEDGTDAAYLIEMNPRCTPLCHLQLGKGRDLVGALWAHLSGELVPDTPPVTENRRIAYFPQAWLCHSDQLESSFQDVPWEEPDLVQELLHPWPERTLLHRVLNPIFDSLAKAGDSAKEPKAPAPPEYCADRVMQTVEASSDRVPDRHKDLP